MKPLWTWTAVDLLGAAGRVVGVRPHNAAVETGDPGEHDVASEVMTGDDDVAAVERLGEAGILVAEVDDLLPLLPVPKPVSGDPSGLKRETTQSASVWRRRSSQR